MAKRSESRSPTSALDADLAESERIDRLRAAGLRPARFELPQDLVAKLEALASERGVSRDDALAAVLEERFNAQH